MIEHRPAQVLTERESRVAALTAAGFTNREIGERLLFSPRTVESTLSRAYLKLGLRSRVELAARLGAPRVTGQSPWAEDEAK